MPVFIRAWPENLPVLFRRPGGIVQLVGSVEMFLAAYVEHLFCKYTSQGVQFTQLRRSYALVVAEAGCESMGDDDLPPHCGGSRFDVNEINAGAEIACGNSYAVFLNRTGKHHLPHRIDDRDVGG